MRREIWKIKEHLNHKHTEKFRANNEIKKKKIIPCEIGDWMKVKDEDLGLLFSHKNETLKKFGQELFARTVVLLLLNYI